MTALRATVILKTDISGSTARFRALGEADLQALLAHHREFVTRHAAAQGGRIVKPEGDGFWLAFPSATGAALAAMTMQEDLRLAQPTRGDDRLAMRVVIALGDVLHEEGALVGDSVVLAARIEALTPPDEIYLSAAAWLALNQAEVRSALVDAFPLKGFDHPVPVYRVEQTHRTRVLADQYIVFTDLRVFHVLVESAPMTTVEAILDALIALTGRACRAHGGVVRFSSGDSYCLTFDAAEPALAAAENLRADWNAFLRERSLPCTINIAVHRGTLYAYRSYLYGPGLNAAGGVEVASTATLAPGEGGIFVTEAVREALPAGWHARLRPVDAVPRRFPALKVYRLAERAADAE